MKSSSSKSSSSSHTSAGYDDRDKRPTDSKSSVAQALQSAEEEEMRAKKKKMLRYTGGKAWEDKSMLEWPESLFFTFIFFLNSRPFFTVFVDDFRMWCGDLGNDVTDELLAKAFSVYPSFQKAKVIRDIQTKKSKGYGFLRFSFTVLSVIFKQFLLHHFFFSPFLFSYLPLLQFRNV
jgi:hypothetical protein